MKKANILLLAGIVALLAACTTAKESTGVWVNREKIQGKSFNNIFIMVMTKDMAARTKLESDLAATAIQRGYKAVKSLDVMAPSFNDKNAATKEEIEKKVKEFNCDAVFVASLLKKEEEVRYTPGSSAYSVSPYYSWSGTYFGYYSHWYPTVSTPGYYTKEKNYFMQSNLYDAASEEIMWSVQSEIFDPASISRFSKAYTKSLITQLEKENLMKK